MFEMSTLDLTHKRILIRADLNVPLNNGKITSTKRIQAIIPTLKMALAQKASIILMSHLGRPQEGTYDLNLSLSPVAHCLSAFLSQPVRLIEDFTSGFSLDFGQVVLLENTRFLVGEKANDPQLSQALASLADIFVNDAFATAHRKEASTYGVAQFAPIACAGPLLLSEIKALQQVLKHPKPPCLAIVAGAKVSTKLLILKNILSKLDFLIVGGGIANTFLAAQGFPVGNSLYESELIPQAKNMLEFAKQHHKKIILPCDVVVATDFSAQATAVDKELSDVKDEDIILDVGPRTCEKIRDVIQQSNTILWNGPLGVFEWPQFSAGTKALANAIAARQAYSIAGGGDTLAAIEKYHMEDKLSYISTGGGAFLEFLEGKKLPAIEILEKRFEFKPAK